MRSDHSWLFRISRISYVLEKTTSMAATSSKTLSDLDTTADLTPRKVRFEKDLKTQQPSIPRGQKPSIPIPKRHKMQPSIYYMGPSVPARRTKRGLSACRYAGYVPLERQRAVSGKIGSKHWH